MIIDKITNYLDGQGQKIDTAILKDFSTFCANSFERQFGQKKEEQRTLRISSIGRCQRQQAYNILGFPRNGKEIDSRAKIVFFFGDLVEGSLIALMRSIGLNVVGCQQTLVFEGIEGHPDGIFINDASERFLLEIKSMSSYSFADFQKGIIDDGYLAQTNCYMYALGLHKCVFVAINKDSGVLHEAVISRNDALINELKDKIRVINASTKESLPERPYSANEKGFYPWQCLYCGFWGECLDAERVIEKDKYRLKRKGQTNDKQNTQKQPITL